MKNRISLFQGAKPLFLAAFLSGLLAGCGTTPPPLPSGERVPINHYAGQWTPADDLTAKHETPQEKAKRIKQERLALIRQQKEIAAKKAEEAREAARKLEEEKAKAVSETQVETKPEVFPVKESSIKETVTPITKEEAKAESVKKVSPAAEESKGVKAEKTKPVSQKKKVSASKSAASSRANNSASAGTKSAQSKEKRKPAEGKEKGNTQSFNLWPVYQAPASPVLLKHSPLPVNPHVAK